MNDVPHEVERFCQAGVAVVAILPRNGKPSKGPGDVWNRPRSTANPLGFTFNPEDFAGLGDVNYGAFHGVSRTLALDLDNLELARKVFSEATGTDPHDWLNNATRLEIKSPKAGRGKLLFRLPDGFEGARLRQFKHGRAVIFELRCGDGCQDVIHGKHPEGGTYQIIGDPERIPEAPPLLLDMLAHWDEWKPCLDSVLAIEQEPPRVEPRKAHGESINGMRDPIAEFNQAYGVVDVLLRNRYQHRGKDRFIRPGSKSGAPGAVIMRNCADGIARVFSHGGDVLNDGYAHDAFDCFRLLECGGDWEKAFAWNPDLTKHNQRLWAQQNAAQGSQSTGNVQEGRKAGKAAPFPLVPASELTQHPVSIAWLIRDILERESLNLLFGEPGAGKSLFALDWAFCVAAGIDWHGKRVVQADVVVIAGEGFAGMSRRLKALEHKYGISTPANLFISKRPAQLLDTNNAQWVADAIAAATPNPGLVVVDTLHRNMAGDENSSEDIATFIGNIDLCLKPLGCAVLVVHHSGHGDKQRSRGSSAIRAAMDGEFSATRNDGGVALTCTKSKDFEAFAPLQFGIEVARLDWLDDEGEPLTSVYIEHRGEAEHSGKRRKLSARDDAILTSLGEATEEHGVTPSPEIRSRFAGFDGLFGEGRKVVHIDHWRGLAYKAMCVDSDTDAARRMAFKRSRDKLLNGKWTQEYNNFAWRIYD